VIKEGCSETGKTDGGDVMKKQTLGFEALEERQLLAVWAGAESTAASEAVASPEPTAGPSGYAIGDVYISSTIDIGGDGFIGPAELSYMSGAWLAVDGSEDWNPACDLDGDGFIGPGDFALLSGYWFKTADQLPEETKSYEIYPSDISGWLLFGDRLSGISAVNGILTLDARSGILEATCDYVFADNLRVTADFRAPDALSPIQAGLELAVQESGARYYFEIQADKVYLYHVAPGESMTLLTTATYSFDHSQTYTIWGQVVEGQVAFGVGNQPLIAMSDASVSGGMVGFYATNGVATFKNISVEYNPPLQDPIPIDDGQEEEEEEEISSEEMIWNFLYENLGNAYGAAGMMGNLYAESGLRSNNLQNSYERSLGMSDEVYTAAVDDGSYTNFVYDAAGYGLAQWTFWSRKQALLNFAQARGKSIGDLEMQLDYLWQELGGYTALMQILTTATSVREASDAVLTMYERPADQSEAAKIRRASFGQIFYDRYYA